MSFNKVVFFRDADAPQSEGGAEAPVRNIGYGEDNEEVAVEEAPITEAVETPAEEPVKETAAAAVEIAKEVVAAPVYDWRKEVKGLNKKELLKEVGLDDFTLEMLEYREKTGDYLPYLQAHSVNYTEMDADKVLMEAMRRDNPGMTERALLFKFNKDLSDRYYLDRDMYEEGSDEAVFGQEQMRLDAEKQRKGFIETQQSFRAPEKQPDVEATQREAAEQQRRDVIAQTVTKDASTVALTTSKTIKFGEGEESFNYPVDNVDGIIDNALSALIFSGNETLEGVNMSDFYKSLVIGKDPNKFLAAYDKHRDAVTHKRFQDELHNRKPRGNGDAAPAPTLKNFGYGQSQ